MVYTKPPGGGGTGGSSRRHRGCKLKSHHKRRGDSSHKRKTHPRVHHHTRAPAVPTTTAAHVGQTFGGEGGLPRQAHTGSGAAPAIELAPPFGSSGLFDALLEVVGAEHLTVRGMFEAWQREQDRAFNRSWRRPGGLARPAGL